MRPSSDTGVGRTAHLRARQVQARLKMPGSGGSPDQALRSGASGRRSTSTSPGPGPRPASGGGSWEGLRRQHSRLSAGGARCAPIIFAVARRARTQHLMRASLSLSLCVLRSLSLSPSLSLSLSVSHPGTRRNRFDPDGEHSSPSSSPDSRRPRQDLHASASPTAPIAAGSPPGWFQTMRRSNSTQSASSVATTARAPQSGARMRRMDSTLSTASRARYV